MTNNSCLLIDNQFVVYIYILYYSYLPSVAPLVPFALLYCYCIWFVLICFDNVVVVCVVHEQGYKPKACVNDSTQEFGLYVTIRLV